MAPTRKPIDMAAVLATAREVAVTEQAPSRAKVASRLGLVESTLNKRVREEKKADELDAILHGQAQAQVEEPGVSDNDNGSRTGSVKPETPWSAEDVIRFYGDDPEKCQILSQRGTFWGDPEKPNHHLRVNWVSQDQLVHAPDPSDWTPPPKPRRRRKQETTDAVVISDHHAPHFEPEFHALTLEYLRDAQPDLIEVNGDLLDFATISRHRERDGFAQPVNECLASGFHILYDYRDVCPEAKIRLKRGNHDERLRYAILDNARGLHNITPAGDDVAALDLRRLLHLDEIGVEYVDVEWDQAKTDLSSKLTARHGFSTAKNAGDAMLDKLAGSTIQGHSHRLSMTLRTEHTGDPEEPIRVRMALEGGCACIIPGGLGYVPGGEPNWVNALVNFRIWEDGDFHAAPGIFVPGRFLAPNGKRYS